MSRGTTVAVNGTSARKSCFSPDGMPRFWDESVPESEEFPLAENEKSSGPYRRFDQLSSGLVAESRVILTEKKDPKQAFRK